MAKTSNITAFINAIKSANTAFAKGESLMAKAAKIAKEDSTLSAIFTRGRTPAVLKADETRVKEAAAKSYGWTEKSIPTNWRKFKSRIRLLMEDEKALAKAAKAQRRQPRQTKAKAEAKAKADTKAKAKTSNAAPALAAMAIGLNEAVAHLIAIEEAHPEIAMEIHNPRSLIETIISKLEEMAS
jgi:hypothetical protein